MGKAADQRKQKRMKYLVRLSAENPKMFAMEWERRMKSWKQQIHRNAGRLKDSEGRPVPPVFNVVDEAMVGCMLWLEVERLEGTAR